MMCNFKAIFDEDSDLNKKMRQEAEEFKQKSIEEKSCYSCRYSDVIDDLQGYSHRECRLRKKKTDILDVDKNCIFHRTKDDFKIQDYDRKAVLDVFLETLDEEIEDLKQVEAKTRAPERLLKYALYRQQTERIKDKLVWLMGK